MKFSVPEGGQSPMQQRVETLPDADGPELKMSGYIRLSQILM
jgi:hypothetical protein